MAGRVTPQGNPLTLTQLEYYWTNNGGPASVAPIAGAIALAESGGRSVVQQGQPPATTGWGPWQITPGNASLLDPNANARAAVAKYKAAGNSFTPWTTYTSGKYRQFLRTGSNVPAYLLGGGLLAASGLGLATAGVEGAGAAAGAEGAVGGATAGAGAGGLSNLYANAKQGLGIAALASVLLDPGHWLRILMIVGGAILILVALVYMFKSQVMR